METARHSIVVTGGVEETHRRWLEFVGHASPPARGAATASSRLAADFEAGCVYFSAEGAGTTRVTMELRFNPDAVSEAGRDEGWVARRIELYLRRFTEHHLGRA